MEKTLELVTLLAGGYRSGQLAAIKEIIRFVDTPVSVRHKQLAGVEANAAYLDLNEMTRRQVCETNLSDLMWRRDKETGYAQKLEQSVLRVIAAGGGRFRGRVIAGRKEPITNEAVVRVIGPWVVSVLHHLPEAPHTDAEPILYLATPRSCTIHRIDAQPRGRGDLLSSPAQVYQWRPKRPE